MTIICGYHRGNEVWIGADSQIQGGDFVYPETVEKLVRHGPWVLGIAGSALTLRLISQQGQTIAGMSAPEEIADFLQQLYRDAGFKRDETHPGPPDYQQEAVLVSTKGCWSISSNGIVGVPSWGFVSVGSGDRVAFGAAYVAHHKNEVPEAVLRYALEAAISMTATCGGEMQIFCVR